MKMGGDGLRIDRGVLGKYKAGRKGTNPPLVGYWWENDLLILNHFVMENGKDFHDMTLEEYYNEN